MKKIEIGQAITILANVGVIAGLIFVGLQLRQDNLVARQQMAFAAADQYQYWAELVTNNSELWFKGISGDPLTAEEAESFDALARAWQVRLTVGYYGSVELGSSDIQEAYVREAARKIYANPGLSQWWLSNQESIEGVDPAIGFMGPVNGELERLRSTER
jgi:hypothetical protein